MGILGAERRLHAAASSMHQFYPLVRSFFRVPVDDRLVESATLFLYARIGQEIFGARFLDRFQGHIEDRLKYASPADASEQMIRIAERANHFEQVPDRLLDEVQVTTPFEHRVRSYIRALLEESGQDPEDAESVRDGFVRLENVLNRLRVHLTGIKRQSAFLL